MAAASGTAAFDALYGQMAAKSSAAYTTVQNSGPGRVRKKPVMIGSPQYSVYRITSRLQNTCPTILSVASHKNVPPYWALTAGPNSHSPATIDAPASSRPGPSNPIHKRQPGAGASGNSPTPHGASIPALITGPTAGDTGSLLSCMGVPQGSTMIKQKSITIASPKTKKRNSSGNE